MLRLLSMLLLVFGSSVAAAQSVSFRGVAVGSIAAGPELAAQLYKPEGAGPFPAIVLAHTCSGVNAHTATWGRLLSSWGYAVVAPDSFGPRGFSGGLCARGTQVSGSERVTDVAGALDWLNAQAFVQRNRIGLIGHSHGGWTAVRALVAPLLGAGIGVHWIFGNHDNDGGPGMWANMADPARNPRTTTLAPCSRTNFISSPEKLITLTLR